MKKEYKIEMIRISKPRRIASKGLEGIINKYAKDGWVVKSILFHNEIYSYEVVFVKDADNG